jgi:hypothetical protein
VDNLLPDHAVEPGRPVVTVMLEHAEEIAGHEYRMTKFSYEEGIRLGARVLQLLGSAASFSSVNEL